jgi:hypothetical protein
MCRVKQRLEIGHTPKLVRDSRVVGDVVPEIGHRGRIDWAEPHDVDPDRSEIRQLRGDAAQVADAVVIRVAE